MATTPKTAAKRGDAAKAPRKPKAAAPAKAKAAAKAGAAAAATPPQPIEGPVEGGVMKSKALLERVAARAGVPRGTAKPVIEAVLAELGASLSRGESFALAGLGRAKVARSKDSSGGGTMIVVKLKQGGAKKDGDAPLEPAAD